VLEHRPEHGLCHQTRACIVQVHTVRAARSVGAEPGNVEFHCVVAHSPIVPDALPAVLAH